MCNSLIKSGEGWQWRGLYCCGMLDLGYLFVDRMREIVGGRFQESRLQTNIKGMQHL